MWAERPAGTATDNAGRTAFPEARVAYDVSHPITWRARVSAYLWTKSLSAGVAFIAALPGALGAPTGALFNQIAPALALGFLAITGGLLIADLKRPERFWFILVKPHWRSWLTRGAYIITVFGLLLALWTVGGLVGQVPNRALYALLAAVALATAVYTAFLFGQCEARDLWQSPMLGLQLVFQMGVAGSAALLLAGVIFRHRVAEGSYLWSALTWSLIGQLGATWLGELMARHGSPNARAAGHVMTHGRYAWWYWSGLVIGVIAPLILLFGATSDAMVPLAAALALGGLFATEHAFVMAGQAVPIS
jgi:formate-dependent nitrite reductase membrane component NrfD